MTISQPIDLPLGGLRIMVTRPAGARDPLVARLRALGADVLLQPAIRIEPPNDWQSVDAVLARLDAFDWLVFSSANGVRYFCERMQQKAVSSPRAKLAAIGPGTADELLRYSLRADLVPSSFRAEALAEALLAEAPGRRFLLLRASRGREILAERLSAAGATVEQVVAYSSVDVEQPEDAIAALLREGRVDWTTVTSSAIAQSLIKLFGKDLHRTRLASISPLTSGALREHGFEPSVEAAEYTMEGLVSAIVADRLS